MYVIDNTQRTHTVRHNYPATDRFRYFFEHLREFFRQYFFALEREELPLNRAQSSWAYYTANDINHNIAFDSNLQYGLVALVETERVAN